ncbi:arsenate reductase ArsC [Occultella kanbiaonis]|uniref:arsenate reductase ArsC n=1 Tax=Occultella kanbiaonis TaxID=2675754 RepID=UPI0012B6E76F|nr:arsenate reductase ArsC [Occultella kanbiaonis]
MPDRGMPGLLSADHVLHGIAGDLTTRFEGTFTAETIERYVFESYAALARSAKVTAHLPAVTARFAADRLTALAQSEGLLPHEVPEVLFVCVQNAGRSQMAAALLDHHAAGRVHVRSAGSTPLERIHPAAVDVMREVGLDLGREFPKPLTDDVVRAADVVITMGCGDACPIYPGKRYEDWELADPADASLDAARRIRDQIDARVRTLLGEILAPVGESAHR